MFFGSMDMSAWALLGCQSPVVAYEEECCYDTEFENITVGLRIFLGSPGFPVASVCGDMDGRCVWNLVFDDVASLLKIYKEWKSINWAEWEPTPQSPYSDNHTEYSSGGPNWLHRSTDAKYAAQHHFSLYVRHRYGLAIYFG